MYGFLFVIQYALNCDDTNDNAGYLTDVENEKIQRKLVDKRYEK